MDDWATQPSWKFLVETLEEVFGRVCLLVNFQAKVLMLIYILSRPIHSLRLATELLCLSCRQILFFRDSLLVSHRTFDFLQKGFCKGCKHIPLLRLVIEGFLSLSLSNGSL